MYDFHNIDVYPTAQEITKHISPNLPQNIVRGPYQNVRHYLDVHYRLLREDFVAPLREGLCEYLEATRSINIFALHDRSFIVFVLQSGVNRSIPT